MLQFLHERRHWNNSCNYVEALSSLCVEEMQDEFPELREVHALTERADHLEERCLYHSAREIYKDAVSKLLPLIESIMLFACSIAWWVTGYPFVI